MGAWYLCVLLVGTHYRDDKKRNIRLLLKNIDALSGYDSDDTNLRVRSREIAADYKNFWTSEDAFFADMNRIKHRGPSISDASVANYVLEDESPIQRTDAQVCIDEVQDGHLKNIVIDFTAIPLQ